MAKLILIRHAQTRQQPLIKSHMWELTQAGRQRCYELAEHLRPYTIQRVFTSEEAKAILTGEIVASALNIPCESVPDLHETRRETTGYYEDASAFKAAIHQAMLKPDELCFGEETFTHARQRLAARIDSLIRQYPDDTTAIVSHGTVMSLYLAHITGADTFSLWQSLKMPAYAVLSLPDKKLLELINRLPDAT